MNGPLARPRAVDADQAAVQLLAQLVDAVGDLIDLAAGETVILERVLTIGSAAPARNPVDLVTEQGDPWHSLLIENLSAQTLHVGFAGGAGTPAEAAYRVPANTGRVITRPFDVVSIGFDPAVVPASARVTVVRYRRPQPPTGWRLA